MKSNAIRQSFLDYFAQRGHRAMPSAPLIPHGDATLLFVNAGMVPFKNVFLGIEEPAAPRATTAQKCLRVSGKHNDLENVGPSPRHHTFFEMLGNFSFGDYFKEEAISYAWELVTEVFEMPTSRLFATVFREDDEAMELWKKISTLPEGRILRCGEKDNFWSMGDTGPCGPCSEIFFDLNPEAPEVDFETGSESGRYIEFWNLVFMQYDRQSDGELVALPNPSVDTGAGLERLASILQGADSNYGSDLFQPILRAAATLADLGDQPGREATVSLRVIADHLRAVSFLLADGVIPSNEGRGYVLRRILRRASRHGMRLGFEEPFLHRLIPVVGEVLGEAYPELGATEAASRAAIEAEESKFLGTVASGARHQQDAIEAARKAGSERLDGETVFRLYDTYGLPLDTIREIAEEERVSIDEAGFEAAMEAQRERSRPSADSERAILLKLPTLLAKSGGAEETVFAGYDDTRLEGAAVQRVVRLTQGEDGWSADPTVSALESGEAGIAILDRTVFYAESGGQVGDAGEIRWSGGAARVLDTQKDAAGTIFHRVEVREGRLAAGEAVDLRVDAERRRATERNHTATHLLHAALRQTLGDAVRQAGSLVAPDRLRFDFTYPHPVGEDELATIESLVNGWVLRADATRITERGYDEAVADGAMALFGEKYGDVVRTVAIPEVSLELCGGCHVANTGQIGPVVLAGERGVASGVRRIEALSGDGAQTWLLDRRRDLERVEASLGVPAERAAEEIDRLRAELKKRDGELSQLRLQMVAGGAAAGEGDDVLEVQGVRTQVKEVPSMPSNELRNLADTLRSRLGTGVVVLGSRDEGKVVLLVAVSEDLVGRVHAGKLVKALASRVGGGGGGRPDFAQAGGKDPEALPDALAAVPELLADQLPA